LELLVGYLTNQPAVAKLQKEHDEKEMIIREVTTHSLREEVKDV
jgi:hypothetical protein